MLVVEENAIWSQQIKRMNYLDASVSMLDVQVIEAGQLQDANLSSYSMIVVEFDPKCIDSWLRLFDKNDQNTENLSAAVVGVPHNQQVWSWCREIGFSEIVGDLEAVDTLIVRWQKQNIAADGNGDFVQQLKQQIPWP